MAIPILDFTNRSASELRTDRDLARAADRALSTVGTFVLIGHGVPGDVLEAVRSSAADFFSQPDDAKSIVSRPKTPEVARVYFGLAAGVVSVLGMERFSFGPWDLPRGDPYYESDEGRSHFPDNRFPSNQPALEAACRAFFDPVSETSRKIATLFEVALDLAHGTLLDDLAGSTATATAICYPGGATPPEGGVRIQAHNDVDLYTLLRIYDDDRTDLHFLDRDNAWHEVPAVADGFVVNVGDLMQRLTNDRWLATSHRVLVPPGAGTTPDRISLAYFEHPRYDAVVAPFENGVERSDGPAYAPVRVAEFERQRRMLLHLGRTDANAELLAPIEKRLGEG